MDALLLVGLQNALVATLLAALVWSLTHCWRNPLLGRALWLLVLVKLVTPPMWEMPISSVNLWWPSRSEVVAREIPENAVTAHGVLITEWLDDGVSDGLRLHRAGQSSEDATAVQPIAADSVVAVPSPVRSAPSIETGGDESSRSTVAAATLKLLTAINTALASWPQRLSISTIICATWLAGSAVLLIVIGQRIIRFSRDLRVRGREDADVTALIESLSRQVGLQRVPSVRTTEATHPPLVWCLGWRPMIVLPRSLMQQLSEDEQQAVLTHELLHIKRGDHLVRLLETSVLVLFWWHPVVWWARRELQRFEEQCCDADVLRLCPHSSDTYATVLMKTVEFLQSGRPIVVAFTSAMARRHSLIERIERILAAERPPRWSWASRLLTLALLGLLPFSVGHGAPQPQQSADAAEQPRGQIRATASASTAPAESLKKNAVEQSNSGNTSTVAERSGPTTDDEPMVPFTFLGPPGMRISYVVRDGEFNDKSFPAPARLEFAAGQTHRLYFGHVPNRRGLIMFPSLEVVKPHPATASYLEHNRVPVRVTDEDLDQVESGNRVTKVIYLPDPEFQELAIAEPEELVSTRLDPNLDPIAEADRRGTVVAVLRMGTKRASPKRKPFSPYDKGPVVRLSGLDGVRTETIPSSELPDPTAFQVRENAPLRLRLTSIPGHEDVTVYSTITISTPGNQPQNLLRRVDVTVHGTRQCLRGLGGRHVATLVRSFRNPDADNKGTVQKRLHSSISDPPFDGRAEAARSQSTVVVVRFSTDRRLVEEDIDTKAAGSDQTLIPFDRPYGDFGFPGRQFGPHWETVRLATAKPVQDELGLTTEQRRALAPVYASLMLKDGQWSRGGRDEPNQLKEEYDQTLSVLTEEQRRRLDQIIFRRLGFTAFLQSIYGERFGLTPEQRERFQLLWNEHVYRSHQGWTGSEGRAAYHKLQADAFAALTPEQRYRYATLIGPPVQQRVESGQPTDNDDPLASRSTLMPEFVNKVLHWLPTDTETLVVSKDFRAQAFRGGVRTKEPFTLDRLSKSLAALALFDLPADVQEQFVDEHIEWAITGGRNYQITSAFGGYRYDGCMVIKYSKPLFSANRDNPDGQPLIERLSRSTRDRWRIKDVDVFGFPFSTEAREPYIKPRVGEGLYVGSLNDRTLFIATSDMYLLQMLRRINGDDRDRAMPSTLWEWGVVDFDAESWGIRRIPERSAADEETSFTSVVWNGPSADADLTVIYQPRGDAKLQGTLSRLWLGPEQNASLGIRLDRYAAGQAQDAYRVTVQVDTDEARMIGTMRILGTAIFAIYGLPATSF